MSSRSRHHHSRWSQTARLIRRHRPIVIALFAAALMVLAALFVFTQLRGG